MAVRTAKNKGSKSNPGTILAALSIAFILVAYAPFLFTDKDTAEYEDDYSLMFGSDDLTAGWGDVTMIAAGTSHSLALKSDGTVWAWGYNWYGQLGNGTNTDSNTPVQVKGLNNIGYLTDVTMIAAGSNHSLALKSDGTVWAWGYNYYGQLGDGPGGTDRYTPVQVKGLNNIGYLTDVTMIAAGDFHSLALKSDGTVWAWGQNTYGRLGDGTSGTNRYTPVQVKGLNNIGYLTDVTMIAAGTGHSLALKSDGTVWAWGMNTYGQLGDGTSGTGTDKNTPVRVPDLSGATMIAAGGYHSLAMKSNGEVWAWGQNSAGQLGDGPGGTDESRPVQVLNIQGATMIAAGSNHSLALKSDGTVWAWGRNNYEQLGDGTTATVRRVPVQVGVSGSWLTDITWIAAGENHNLTLKSDSTVWAWGRNTNGQLGDGTSGTNKNTPVQSGTDGTYSFGVKMIAEGDRHSLALKSDGTVWAWGYNYYGQLGDGTTYDKRTPVQVLGLSDIIMISAGDSFSLALKSDGTVWAWGSNSHGRLGDGTGTNRSTPVQVKGPGGAGYLTDVKMIAAGDFHSLALKSDGTVWAWGSNIYGGQLGDGTGTSKNTPVRVSGLSDVTMIAGGGYHSLALKSNGEVWAWGRNQFGQLGEGTTDDRNAPVQVSGLSDVTMIAGGGYHSLALKSDGTVWAWGRNNSGQLGNGTSGDSTNKSTPVQVSIQGATMISAGWSYSLALKSDGTVWAWGNNYDGNLGDGTTITKRTPVQVKGPGGAGYLTDVTMIAGGLVSSLALKSDGTVWAWGHNGYGQLGDGTIGTNRLTPVQTLVSRFDVNDMKMIVAGDEHTLALKSDGTVWAWGRNNYGQLGSGTVPDEYTPVPVTGLTDITMIAAGISHSLALKSDGTVWAWGRNDYGQLGDGSTTNRGAPVQVSGLSDVTMIAAGDHHSLAVKSDGEVWAWGWNNAGQIGDGTSGTNRLTPVQVSGISNVTMIAAGTNHSLAMKSNGEVWAWGWNNYGQIGDGTSSTTRFTPVQVSGISNVTMIAAGPSHSLALKSDGTVWAWGRNNNGQIGDGTSGTTKPLPVQVSGLSDVTMIAAGENHSLALKRNGTVWAWGLNTNGQLGDGTSGTNRPAPVQVGVSGSWLTDITWITAGQKHSLALKGNGEVWGWGNAEYSKIGDLGAAGSGADVTAPLRIIGLRADTTILRGIAVIDNMSPKVGDTMNGSLIAGGNTGTLRYQWKADDGIVGTNSPAYTVTAADSGKTITVTIRSITTGGSVTSPQTDAVVKNLNSTMLLAPTVNAKTHNSVTLRPHSEYAEYSIDGTTWQSSNTFYGLLPETAYTFYHRIAETDDTYASDVSPVLNVTTEPIPANALTGIAIISNTTPKIGDVLTASLEDSNDTGTPNYVWRFVGEMAGAGSGPSYTVKEADLGKTLYVTIRSTSGLAGSIMSAETSAITLKDGPDAPPAPELFSKTQTSVTLTANTLYEFSMDGTTWRTSNVFNSLTANTLYTFYQRVAETSDTYASASSLGSDVTTDKIALTGTATIDNTSPKVGDTLTGTYTPGNNTGTLTYRWEAGDHVIITDSPEYIVTADDVGKTIKVTVMSTAEGGSVTSSPTDAVVKMPGPSAPSSAPTLASKTHNSVTLNVVDEYEYSRDGTMWQSSNIFYGLSPETAYTFYQRFAETDYALPSDESPVLNVTTDAIPPGALTGTAAIDNTSPKIGDTLTGTYTPGNNTGTLTYTWKIGAAVIGTGAAYVVKTLDLGSMITLEITSSVETGSLTRSTSAITLKDGPDAPPAPELFSKTQTSVTLIVTDGYEYSRNGTSWQLSSVFNGLTANTPYTFYQRIAETDDALPSAASPVFTVTTDKNVLTGASIISNTAPRIGDVLTGSLTDGSGAAGTLTFQWKADGANIGTNSSTYTVMAADRGKVITLIITASDETGSVTSAGTSAVAKKLASAVPLAPTLASNTHNSVILAEMGDGYEYSRNGTTWQTSNVFTSLSPETAYTFYQRFAETDDTLPSGASPVLSVTTDPIPPGALAGIAIISNTAPRIGDVLTGLLEDDNNSGTLSYQWFVGGVDKGISSTYTVLTADFGKVITVVITSDVEMGSVTSPPTDAVVKMAGPSAPLSAPTAASKTQNSVTLNVDDGYEYSRNGTTWQPSNVFDGLTANTPYTFYQRIAETDDALPSAASPVLNVTTDKNVLTGIATIDKTSPMIGDVLTGSLTDGSGAAGTLTYQWKADDTNVGTNSSTYTVIAADRGKVITLIITASDETGSVTSAGTSAVVMKTAPPAPLAPTLGSKTYNSVTLTADEENQYSRDGAIWQTSNVFTGLLPETAYTFYQRIAETSDTYASDASPVLSVTTDPIPPGALTGTANISNTSPRIGDVLTGSLTESNNTGTLSYQWKADDTNVGTNSSTYTVVVADLGKMITLFITSDVETETVTSAGTSAVAKKLASAPSAPILVSKTQTSVTLTANALYEFSINGTTWQSSNVFDGLTENTAYTFYQRTAETSDTLPSVASPVLNVTTDGSDPATETGDDEPSGGGISMLVIIAVIAVVAFVGAGAAVLLLRKP